jgi:hypothetical protein
MNIATFWSRVDRTAGPDACWPWTGAINKHGYGTVRLPGNLFVRAHRLAYALVGNALDDDKLLDHVCHNDSGCTGTRKECLHRRCCNPAHGEPVTQQVNNDRGNSYRQKERRMQITDLDSPVGETYEDRDSRSAAGRRIKVLQRISPLNPQANTARYRAEVIANPGNPKTVGRKVTVNNRTLSNHYRKVSH